MELAIGSLFGIGIVQAIQVPFIYKYGAEKGRIQIFIAIAVVAFLIGGVLWIGEEYGINLLSSKLLSTVMEFLPIVLLLATATIYFVSYKLAYRIYCKKEIE